jgi:hypothetical protein
MTSTLLRCQPREDLGIRRMAFDDEDKGWRNTVQNQRTARITCGTQNKEKDIEKTLLWSFLSKSCVLP